MSKKITEETGTKSRISFIYEEYLAHPDRDTSYLMKDQFKLLGMSVGLISIFIMTVSLVNIVSNPSVLWMVLLMVSFFGSYLSRKTIVGAF